MNKDLRRLVICFLFSVVNLGMGSKNDKAVRSTTSDSDAKTSSESIAVDSVGFVSVF